MKGTSSNRIFWLNHFLAFIGIVFGVFLGSWIETRHEQKKEQAETKNALSNVLAEIQRNQVNLDSAWTINQVRLDFLAQALPYLDESLESTNQAKIDSLKAVFEDRIPKTQSDLNLNFELYQLSSIAWETMTQTGLAAKLDYDLAMHIQGLYSLQQKVLDFNNTIVELLTEEKMSKKQFKQLLRKSKFPQQIAKLLKQHVNTSCMEKIEAYIQ